MLKKILSYFKSKSWVKRVLFSFLTFILLYLLSKIFVPYEISSNYNAYDSSIQLAIDWVISFTFCILISEFIIKVHSQLNVHYLWTGNALKRLLVEISILLSGLCIIMFTQGVIFAILYDSTEDIFNLANYLEFWNWVLISIIAGFIVSGINTANFLLISWKNSAVEAEQVKTQLSEQKKLALEAELYALKLQLDPHFIFNNLSVLSELILKDQKLGYEYAENFTKVYRYFLVYSKKDLILLKDELNFLNSYIFLIKNRIGDGVVFQIDINEKLSNYRLPPFSLQLLLENALKHNKTLKSSPLKIIISSTENDEVLVSNKLIPLENISPSSKIGLQNIQLRFKLLCNKNVMIIRDDNYFKVYIPLMK